MERFFVINLKIRCSFRTLASMIAVLVLGIGLSNPVKAVTNTNRSGSCEQRLKTSQTFFETLDSIEAIVNRTIGIRQYNGNVRNIPALIADLREELDAKDDLLYPRNGDVASQIPLLNIQLSALFVSKQDKMEFDTLQSQLNRIQMRLVRPNLVSLVLKQLEQLGKIARVKDRMDQPLDNLRKLASNEASDSKIKSVAKEVSLLRDLEPDLKRATQKDGFASAWLSKTEDLRQAMVIQMAENSMRMYGEGPAVLRLACEKAAAEIVDQIHREANQVFGDLSKSEDRVQRLYPRLERFFNTIKLDQPLP